MHRILIADDDDSMRRLVRATLGSECYEVIEATDGGQAWHVLRERRPALAILDWEMPVYSGLELCATIKGDPCLAATRVMLLTGRAAVADLQAGCEAHADAYLTKPFSPAELLALVGLLLAEAAQA